MCVAPSKLWVYFAIQCKSNSNLLPNITTLTVVAVTGVTVVTVTAVTVVTVTAVTVTAVTVTVTTVIAVIVTVLSDSNLNMYQAYRFTTIVVFGNHIFESINSFNPLKIYNNSV